MEGVYNNVPINYFNVCMYISKILNNVAPFFSFIVEIESERSIEPHVRRAVVTK